MKEPGKIIVYTGPMFSQKSTSLFLELLREKYKKKKVIYYKVSLEVKKKVPMDIQTHWSHSPLEHEREKFACFHIPTNFDLVAEMGDEDTIAIDEYQFFERKWIHPQVLQYVNAGKKVLVAGLDRDYMGNIFESMAYITAEADKVYKKTAVCYYSGEPATHSWKIGGDLSKRLETGASDKYLPVCRRVFNQLKAKFKEGTLVQ
ncbi:MAG: hypothetical protein D6805_07000 [Planctomycetota bacterium]|nr:MAG: hypothetical protein D6805_07000 [Planctomycetota bacterium]